MKISEQYKFLEYIHDIGWNDVFSVWRAYESYQKSWEEHWKERGFESWDQWRENYISLINPKDKKWKVYRVNDLKEVKNFYGVPSRGWISKCYGGETTKKIDEILEHPVVKNNDKVEAIMKNFPYQTMLTGIVSDGKIILVEGMHRVLALAFMTKNGAKHGGDVVIALAEHEGEISILGKGDNKK